MTRTKPSNSLIETKVGGGSFSYLTIGYAVWACLSNIPWVQANLSLSLQQQAPFLIAWFVSSIVMYYLPHTHRPDLPAPRHAATPGVATPDPSGYGVVTAPVSGDETADAGAVRTIPPPPRPRIEEQA